MAWPDLPDRRHELGFLARIGSIKPLFALPRPLFRWSNGLPLIPLGLFVAFALYQTVRENHFQDFYIHRAGAEVALRGESPYEPDKLREHLERQWPGDPLADNAGFFQPPAGILIYVPVAVLPYPVAKFAWALLNGLMAWFALSLLKTFSAPPGSAPTLPPFVRTAVAFGLYLNFLTAAMIVVGQTTFLYVGCVAAGQYLFEKGRPLLGTLLWTIPFMKPHIALPLLPLAWYLGGWRRAAGLALSIGFLNLAGCLLVGRSPLFIKEYVDHLGAAHKAVSFNRAELNSQITSWNRIFIALTGRVIELNALTTLAGYVVWYGLVSARCALVRRWPSPAWALAVSAAGALVCCQVLGYEALLLALMIPYLRDLCLSGRRGQALVILALIAVQLVPFDFEELALGAPRALGVAGVAVALLAMPIDPLRHVGD